jgi:predicted AlkP superfamily pyrophosphatase or phosphodiesterase
MMNLKTLAGIFLCITLHHSFSQESGQNSEWALEQPYVILISIDGFRYDYAEKYDASTFLDIKSNGSSAESMIPSFPSKTFPNHYTLVTGLYPGNHGIIGNSFYSRLKNETYRLSDKSKVLDGSWYGGKPIWSLAEENGMISASFFWVGSESKISGYQPTYWKAYDASVPNVNRTKQVIDWLKLPANNRPHLITLYFSLVDDAGHNFGPDSDEVKEAVLEIDQVIGELRKELKTLDLPINLIITADHGMAATNSGVALDDIDFKDAIVDVSSTMVMVYHNDSDVLDEIRLALDEKNELEVYSKNEMKEKFGFDNDDRVGDLVALASPPAQISRTPRTVKGGTHGYDPDKFQEMHAVFMIEGPKIKKGNLMPPFRNVHVYPLIVKLLNLPIPINIDGEIDILEGCIKE